jgi:hypothetical protein
MQCELLLSHRGLTGEFKKDYISLFVTLVLPFSLIYYLLTGDFISWPDWSEYPTKYLPHFAWFFIVLFRVKNFVSTWLGQFQPLHNRIAMFDINSDITCVLRLFAFRNDLLHWLCTSKLILKRHVLFSVWFRGCSIWEQHLPWHALLFPVVSATGLDQVPPWVELKGCHICSTGWPDMLICTSSPAISITPIRVFRDFECKRRRVAARLAGI